MLCTLSEQMVAHTRSSRAPSSTSDCTPEIESQLVDGKFESSRQLRKCHLAVEEAVLRTGADSRDVLRECEGTCREANRLLNSDLADIKQVIYLVIYLFGNFTDTKS